MYTTRISKMDTISHRHPHLSTEKPIDFHLVETTTDTNNNYDIEFVQAGSSITVGPIENLNIFYITFCVLISITGLSLFIFILTRKELRQTPTCLLVLNVLVGVITEGVLLFVIVLNSADELTMSRMGCHLMYIVSGFKTVHMQIALFLLFIDRFICFVQPEKHAGIMTPRVVKILICCSVCLEVVFTVAVAYTFGHPRLLHGHMCSTFTHRKSVVLYEIVLAAPPLLVNLMFGLITIGCTLTMCHRLTGDREQETASGRQAVGLILLSALLDVGLVLPQIVFDIGIKTAMFEHDLNVWVILQCLSISFYFFINFILMLLIPDIRSALSVCCKPVKKDEAMPLMRPAS